MAFTAGARWYGRVNGRGKRRGTGDHRGVAADEAALAIAALDAALAHIALAAFVARPDGAVLRANAAGRAMAEADPRGVAAALARASADHDAGGPFTAARIDAGDGPPCFLVVQQRAAATHDERVAAAARRWRLTGRQEHVLAHLVKGASNRAIAEALGCAETTVEVHVSAVLRKSGSESRAELVARFWGAP